ncbi:hypothetical protein O3G_MSEX012878 [Manduca sexta]|uniref:unspecific monooxygenase n=1 Tax=Manduca sexta TaxID=7130 RepID=A0A922CXR9_MANSE|nr:hypothetical protein O3G_MSEX012878 [Manduca sexta]KAG6461812.1 hypothetical protein O3G_MSEX012878 [Manduca sexta]KAG6461813.1 hypothetical protein O3G_MSEX012878 [Manduca sexta]KAG6461814.1 hypothetical protein O3G_MSEX012878 [Manduca sexta]
MITLIWLAILVLVIIQYMRKVYSRFDDAGVSHFKPAPVVGNAGMQVTGKRHVSQDFDILYQTFSNDRFIGRYEMMRPTVILRDLELIKKVAIKDFEYFIDHRAVVDDTVDPLFGRNLFSLKGQEWKEMRSTLSPAFTSSKMRGMVPFMIDVNKQMIGVLKKKIQTSENNYVDIECKDVTTRYANDVIASCAFGVKVDSHTDEDNEFYTKGRSTANFGFRRILVFLGYASFPKLMKKLNISLFSNETTQFFKNLVLSTMKEREDRNIFRPDMIHLLMEAKKGKLTYDEKTTDKADTGFATVEESDIGKKTVNRVWSDTDLVAQATLFFVAGFETISSAMSFILHELAVNPDIQEKLYAEIMENEANTNGKFDYNSIQNLTYLDCVISEALRLWPPAVGLDRMCVRDYNMGRANEKSKKDFIIRKGEGIVVPVYSIHHDPEYFPEPYKFDPDRFSEENKHNIKPMTYIPFRSWA